jgi:hypothetical protein
LAKPRALTSREALFAAQAPRRRRTPKLDRSLGLLIRLNRAEHVPSVSTKNISAPTP